MQGWALLETGSTALSLLCAAYLALRLVGVTLRVRWARHAYPRCLPAPPTLNLRQDRARGLLVGGAVGDAVGLPAESLPPWLIQLRYLRGAELYPGWVRVTRQRGDVSDDTQLTLAVARSITPGGVYLHSRFLDELRQWYGFRLGAGRACTFAARALRRGAPQVLSSQGNGVAIRVGPLALARSGDNDSSLLLQQVQQNAAATHGGKEAASAGTFVALLLRELLRSPSGLDTSELAQIFRVTAQQSGACINRALDLWTQGVALADALERCGTSGHGPETINATVLLLLHCGGDLREVLTALYRSGGDTDSIGAIVGSCIGAQHGLSALPQRWTARVQHRAYLVDLADRLVSGSPQPTFAGELVELEGNLTTRPVEAWVNAWNRNIIPAWLLLPQGVSGAIKRAGGRRAIAEVSRRAPLPLGSATETHGADTTARWIIHVAGIDAAWRGSAESTRTSTQNALLLARCLGACTVALPLIGAGSGGLSSERCRSIMREVIEPELEHFERIELVRYAG